LKIAKRVPASPTAYVTYGLMVPIHFLGRRKAL